MARPKIRAIALALVLIACLLAATAVFAQTSSGSVTCRQRHTKRRGQESQGV